ncbi:MAG: MBL fold metallo-hydrolase, partial [Phycisphaerae bacterium]
CFRIEGWASGYVVRAGQMGICIDAAAGQWTERIGQIGINRIGYVLATHHHRDTLASAGLLVRRGAALIGPAGEAELICRPEQFWQTARTYVLYNCGSEFFSLRDGVPVERAVADGEVLELAGRRVQVIALPGHTRGSVGYVIDLGPQRLVFVGDALSGPGWVHNWHDLHWGYMDFNTGARALREALSKVGQLKPSRLLPAHGAVIEEPDEALERLDANLGRFIKAVEPNRQPRGYDEYRRISEHVHYVGLTTYAIIADSGKGFFWDFGYVPATRQRLELLAEQAGLKQIDVVSMSHYHDDHILRIAELAYAATGTDHAQGRGQIWCHQVLYDILRRPHAYRLPCLVPTPLPIDRVLGDERFEWEGIEMEMLHLPGQTYWHAGLIVRVDGRTMAFTGDNMWRPAEASRPINGPIIARNRYLPGKGHDYSARRLIERGVDMICPAHGEPFIVRRAELEGYLSWAEEAARAIRELAPMCPLGVDAWWCRVDPFHIHCRAGQRVPVAVVIDSPFDRPVKVAVELCVPPGF